VRLVGYIKKQTIIYLYDFIF